ncbi:hypothetical protein BGCPKDLD_5259 [Methylorubrum suomiense]|uniref:Uncharacterized protein n=1 Tax=Methylorubrum suomiense TaxID=144191 RepID=A0ABQ4V217_9HYPH|nr:hypothetical protein BGCPKDLD_5259 [Methylorubrum suomiense]
MLRESIPSPAPVPAPLDEILEAFAYHGIRPTRLNVLAAALDAGHPPDFAVTLADEADRRNIDGQQRTPTAAHSHHS